MEVPISIYVWITLLVFVAYTESEAPTGTQKTTQYELRFFHTGKSFTDAMSFCEDRNSKLVEIKDETITAAVDAWLTAIGGQAFYWIGATDQDTEGEWKWNDGSSLEYTNWYYAGNPPTNSSQNCAAVGNGSNKKWEVKSCSETLFPICQTDLNSILFFNNTEYTFYRYTEQGGSLSLNFTEARTACQQKGSELVEIKSSAVEDELNKDLKDRNGDKKHYWTSGNFLETERTWVWGDGTNFTTHTNWRTSPNEPNGDTRENCLVKYDFENSEWKWVDFECSDRIGGYICQKDASSGICSNDLCSNNGTCTVNNRKYQCSCDFGFVGDKCHRELILFTDNECKFHINMDNALNYTAARNKCIELSGSLVMIKNATTQNFLTEKIKSIHGVNETVGFWIGGEKLNGRWSWLDGTNVPLTNGPGYSKWAAGEPGAGDCLVLSAWQSWKSSGYTQWDELHWFDNPCTRRRGYICEFPVNPPCSFCVHGTCKSTGCQEQRPCICDAGYSGELCDRDLLRIWPTNNLIIATKGEYVNITLHIVSYDGSLIVKAYRKGNSTSFDNMTNIGNVTVEFTIGPIDETSAGVYYFRAYPMSMSSYKTAQIDIIVYDWRRFFNSECKYHIGVGENLQYPAAKNKCIEFSGSLAMIKNTATHDFLRDKIKSMYGVNMMVAFWIGGHKLNGSWWWLDGTNMPMKEEPGSHWDVWKPNNNGDCLIMTAWRSWRNSGAVQWDELNWFDSPCSNKNGYICEFPDPANIWPSNNSTIAIKGEYVNLTLHVVSYDGPLIVKAYREKNSTSFDSKTITANGIVEFTIGPVDETSAGVYYFRAYPMSLKYCKTARMEIIVHVAGFPEILEAESDNCSSDLGILWKPDEQAVGVKHIITATSVNFSADSQNITIDEIPTDVSERKTTITNLATKTKYEITIEVACEYCSFSLKTSIESTTGIGVSNKVMNVSKVHNKENKTCMVSWSPPYNTKKGEIDSYQVTKISKLIHLTNGTTENITTANTNFFLFTTSPNRNYTLVVQPVNCAGLGPPVYAAGFCVSNRDAPDSVPEPEIMKNSETNDGTRDIKIRLPSETNGLISCMLMILTLGSASTESLTRKDLNEIQQETENKPTSGSKYIAIAIPRSNFSDNSLEAKLGDGSKSSCVISGNADAERRKRNVEGDTVYKGENWPLADGQKYSYFAVAAASTENGVQLQPSPVSEFATEEKKPVNEGGSSTWVIGLVAGLLLLLGLVLLLVYVNKKRKQKLPTQNAGKVQFTATRKLRQQITEDECPYVNLDLENQPESETEIFLENLHEVFNVMKENENKMFKEEFQKLKLSLAVNTFLTAEVASSVALKKKNRYKNILPYDQTRVILARSGDNGYINACFVDGYQQPKKFIATQGPLPSTVDDFWLMTSEQKVNVIVMLTKCMEGGKKKCEKYWPDLGQSSTHGMMVVSNNEEVHLGGFLRRTLILRNGEDEEQTVIHYQFLNWPDHGIPTTTSNFFRLHKAVIKSHSSTSATSPIIVHCSAGAGRTGALIGFDILLDQCESRSRIDVFECVLNMRQQRMDMVQTLSQYILVHKLILESWLFRDTDGSGDDVRDKLEKSLKKTGEDKLAAEFEKLSLTEPINNRKCGQLENERHMNRNSEIVPYETRKIIVVRQPEDSESPYINASTIESYDTAISLIAAQGPMTSTIEYFWRAIFDNDVNTVIMLTELMEDGKEQCAQYWPEKCGNTMTFGNLSVFLFEVDEEDTVVQRKFKLSRDKETKNVLQYHYADWGSYNCPPDAFVVLDLITKLISNVREHPHATGLVHCSDGGGRTGAFCAILNIVERLKCENRVDVFRAVKDLRDCRQGMVQTLDQYRFCHKAVLDYLSTFDLYSNYVPSNVK